MQRRRTPLQSPPPNPSSMHLLAQCLSLTHTPQKVLLLYLHTFASVPGTASSTIGKCSSNYYGFLNKMLHANDICIFSLQTPIDENIITISTEEEKNQLKKKPSDINKVKTHLCSGRVRKLTRFIISC